MANEEIKNNGSEKPIDPVVPEVVVPKNEKKEPSIPLSQVQAMIDKALAGMKEAEKPQKPKRITEHMAHVWRLDGKWVVDFQDRNTDPYVKDKIFAFNKYNADKREFESWIELIFEDGSKKEISLYNYIQNRVLVYCTIIKRHQVDKSYVIGEVEQKKEVGDKLVGTGVMVDQEVTMVGEVFEVKTPEGEILKLNSYVIC